MDLLRVARDARNWEIYLSCSRAVGLGVVELCGVAHSDDAEALLDACAAVDADDRGASAGRAACTRDALADETRAVDRALAVGRIVHTFLAVDADDRGLATEHNTVVHTRV